MARQNSHDPESCSDPFVGDSEERGGPSKGCEDHDAKHEQHRRNTHPAVYAVERLGRSRGARASSAAMITSCRRSHLSGDRPCTLMLSTHTNQTGSATVMRGATHFSRAKSRPGASDTHHVLQRIRASVKSPRHTMDRYKPVILWVVHFSDSEVPSSNLELQREVIS